MYFTLDTVFITALTAFLVGMLQGRVGLFNAAIKLINAFEINDKTKKSLATAIAKLQRIFIKIFNTFILD